MDAKRNGKLMLAASVASHGFRTCFLWELFATDPSLFWLQVGVFLAGVLAAVTVGGHLHHVEARV